LEQVLVHKWAMRLGLVWVVALASKLVAGLVFVLVLTKVQLWVRKLAEGLVLELVMVLGVALASELVMGLGFA